MAHRIAVSTLNASTVDIINTIRANASAEYQSLVPTISQANEIPRVGEVLYGYPALANQFLTSLVNRIAMVRINSATFNNEYAELKKGYLEFGETVEEAFVSIAKAREFSAEKAEARELKRSIPDVRTAFHSINWRVQYPITIQNEDLRMAFQNAQGVQDLIAKIVDAVYTGAEYDEFLLFKYLLIKGVNKGAMYPVAIGTTMNEAAVAFRGASNKLTFMSKKYNSAGVTTNTKKDVQYIFMDSDFNANYDVNVLAAAFNMDKAEFMGKLKLIDDFTSFDNDRFDVIRANSDGLEEVTATELSTMANVKAILVDSEWFQIYDNLNVMTEKYVASGMYWNYFYNVWKIVSFSPFSNAVCFASGSAAADPATIDFVVESVARSENAIVINLVPASDEAQEGYKFIQDEDNTEDGIAIHRYGAIIAPNSETVTETNDITFSFGSSTYTASGLALQDDSTASPAVVAVAAGDTVTFTKDA